MKNRKTKKPANRRQKLGPLPKSPGKWRSLSTPTSPRLSIKNYNGEFFVLLTMGKYHRRIKYGSLKRLIWWLTQAQLYIGWHRRSWKGKND